MCPIGKLNQLASGVSSNHLDIASTVNQSKLPENIAAGIMKTINGTTMLRILLYEYTASELGV